MKTQQPNKMLEKKALNNTNRTRHQKTKKQRKDWHTVGLQSTVHKGNYLYTYMLYSYLREDTVGLAKLRSYLKITVGKVVAKSQHRNHGHGQDRDSRCNYHHHAYNAHQLRNQFEDGIAHEDRQRWRRKGGRDIVSTTEMHDEEDRTQWSRGKSTFEAWFDIVHVSLRTTITSCPSFRAELNGISLVLWVNESTEIVSSLSLLVENVENIEHLKQKQKSKSPE